MDQFAALREFVPEVVDEPRRLFDQNISEEQSNCAADRSVVRAAHRIRGTVEDVERLCELHSIGRKVNGRLVLIQDFPHYEIERLGLMRDAASDRDLLDDLASWPFVDQSFVISGKPTKAGGL